MGVGIGRCHRWCEDQSTQWWVTRDHALHIMSQHCGTYVIGWVIGVCQVWYCAWWWALRMTVTRADGHAERHKTRGRTDRQTDRHTNKQTNKHTNKYTDNWPNPHTPRPSKYWYFLSSALPGGLHLDPANLLAPPPFLRVLGSMRPFLNPWDTQMMENTERE